MVGFATQIEALERRRFLSKSERAKLRALKLRQARLERRVADAEAATLAKEAEKAQAREALAAEVRRLAQQELLENLAGR